MRQNLLALFFPAYFYQNSILNTMPFIHQVSTFPPSASLFSPEQFESKLEDRTFRAEILWHLSLKYKGILLCKHSTNFTQKLNTRSILDRMFFRVFFFFFFMFFMTLALLKKSRPIIYTFLIVLMFKFWLQFCQECSIGVVSVFYFVLFWDRVSPM
jgi:hypothetical protein